MLPVNQCYYKLTWNIKLLWVKNKSFPLKIHVLPLRQKLAATVYTIIWFFSQIVLWLVCLNTLWPKNTVTKASLPLVSSQTHGSCLLPMDFFSVLNTRRQCMQRWGEIPPMVHVLLQAVSDLWIHTCTCGAMHSQLKDSLFMAARQRGGIG